MIRWIHTSNHIITTSIKRKQSFKYKPFKTLLNLSTLITLVSLVIPVDHRAKVKGQESQLTIALSPGSS